MVAINRKNDLKAAMNSWFNENTSGDSIVIFYVISSNYKKWVGRYGEIGFVEPGRTELFTYDKGEERIAARILNFPANRLTYKCEFKGDYLFFIFDGDWVKVCPGLYYSKELDNYYWTGGGFDYPTWHGNKYSELIKSYLREFKSYDGNNYLWEWWEETVPEDPEEVAIEDQIRNYSAVLHNAIIDLLNPECDGEIFWEDRKIGDFKDGQGYFYSDDVDALKDMVERLYTGYTCRLEDGKIVFREGWVVE